MGPLQQGVDLLVGKTPLTQHGAGKFDHPAKRLAQLLHPGWFVRVGPVDWVGQNAPLPELNICCALRFPRKLSKQRTNSSCGPAPSPGPAALTPASGQGKPRAFNFRRKSIETHP